MSARDRIRDFFERNVGKVVTTHEIQEVAKISEYARRIRELRDEEGMQILSHHDRADLKSNQYLLETVKREPKISSAIPPRLRNEILERNGYSCQLCGAGPGDPDPYNPSRKVRLHIDHIRPGSHSGPPKKENLRVLCSTCNQQRSNIDVPSEPALTLLARIRKAPRNVQKEIYEKLSRTFAAPSLSGHAGGRVESEKKDENIE